MPEADRYLLQWEGMKKVWLETGYLFSSDKHYSIHKIKFLRKIRNS